MAIVKQIPGTPVLWTVGRRGEPFDIYPARIFDVVPGTDPNGRPSPLATVIVERHTLDGELYLADQDVPLRFLLPREERNEALDGTSEAPKSMKTLVAELTASKLAFITAQAAATTVAGLEAELDA